MSEWKSRYEELPPCDGSYEITNYSDPDNKCYLGDLTVANYDGFGFEVCGIYRYPKYWREYVKPEKRYGKIK